MTTNYNLLTGSLLNVLNTSSVITKPHSDYVGSLFLNQNQELTMRSNSPRGRVRSSESFIANKSFGTSFEYDKVYNIFVDFYTVRHVKDRDGAQDYELVNKYLQFIEDAVVTNSRSFGRVTIIDIKDQDAPDLLDEVGMNVIGATKLIVFQERR